MDAVTIHRLESAWADSVDEPLALYESSDPSVQTGSYVIEAGERVPETGTTSHDGDEISVILEGEVELVADGERYTAGPGTLSVIEAGTSHYSVNTGEEPCRLVYTVLGDL
ncbi:cupin domain-containing protein [Halobacteria archaeon AArc-curdl1]|uniref:Cupin domain-containing protein n=1 Tax=Natronosalvus hydrolyticus TaxID=2979988 RepID=A0AAP3E8E9_9EURY|nr:cupin domain-containing protein [Halobacteria archaeon AArc-curdl1]